MRNIKKLFHTTIFLLGLVINIFAQTPIYLDPNASINDRVNDLLSRMTLDEKIGQMTQADNNAVGNLDDLKTYFLGSILSGGGSDPVSGNTALDWANLYDSFQEKALQTRLMIPIIYGIDAVHGHSNVVGAVIFPHNIGLGATRNPELVKRMAKVTAEEMTATGIDWTFAPCVAVPRNERWGRTYEGFGETPELVSLLSGPAVLGFQNDSLNSPTSIVACAKHFIGDGGTTNGVDQGNTEISEEELRRIHLPGYIAAINAGVRTIMASYSSWNGVKMHGNKYLLTDVLKTELGFDGFIISDWAGIDQIPGDYTSDIETSINAGVDMVMVPNDYVNFIAKLKLLVQANNITQEKIDGAVKRILLVKFEFGLFEHPFADRTLLPNVGSAEHRAVAKQCVMESVVLLKKNDKILPLPNSNIRVLVAGKHADDIGRQCGGWTIQWGGGTGDITEGTTILEGLRKVAPNVEFVYDENGNFDNTAADYAIAVIGEEPYAEGGGDRDDLTIAKDQILLVRKLKNLGLPVITILISGRPMIINPVLHNSDAFLAGWLPGTEADGIAEIIVGNSTPKGLLPATWPKNMEQIPINFGDSDYHPLFPYGFGITSFDNSEVGSAPIFQSGMVTEDGLHIELAFNKSMNNENNSSANFTVLKNGSDEIQVINFELDSLDEKMLLLALSDNVSKNDVVLISYNSGNLSSADSGVVSTFSNQEVINFLNYSPSIQNIPGKIQAEDYSDMHGIQTENTSDSGGGLNVGWIDDGDWLEYNSDIEFSGTYFINYRIASESNGGILKLFVDGNETDTQTIPVTNGWQNWQTVTNIINLTSGKSTLKLLAEQGGFNLNWFEFALITDAKSEDEIPSEYVLNQNYPNPFNLTTIISYTIPTSKFVNLSVFNVQGQLVQMIINKHQQSGKYSIAWDATGKSTGVYFYKLESGNFTDVKKCILIK